MLPDIDKELFSILFDESLEGYYDWDMVSNTGYISPTLKKLFGYEENEFTNFARIGEVHLLPVDIYKAKAAFEEHVASKGKIPYNISLRYKHKQGTILHLQSKAKVISWTEEGGPKRVIGFYINVTPYILTEEKIKHNNALLELIVDGINAGIWERDFETGTEWWSNRFYTLLGYDKNEIEPRYETFIKFLHNDDRQSVIKAVQNHLDTQEPYTLQVRLKCRNNQYRWFETTGKALFNDEGKPARIAGSIIDIHETKTAQMALQKSEHLMQQVGALGKAGGWELNLKTNVLHWSKPVYDIYEVSPEYKPTLKKALQFIDPAYTDIITSGINEAIANGTPYDVELKFITAKKRNIWVRAIGKAVYNENNEITGLQGIFQDIDSLKKSEEFLKQTNSQKDKLFSIISHDLRSPVSQIRMFIELMLRHKERYAINEKQLDLLITIKRNAENTYNLLDDLLAWSTNQFRHNAFVPKNLLLIELTKRVLEQLESSAIEKRVNIILNIEDGYWITADENMLKTIMRNLVSNAIKFSNKEGNITVTALHKDDSTIITVKDCGVGIPKEDVSKLFSSTTNFTTYGTNMEKGTGLGLNFCKEFVEQHGGNISVQSEPGKGSTFKVEIPDIHL